MTGAFGLEPNILNGEILLNLDTEEDDEIDIGCAGGIDVTATQKYEYSKVTENGFRITVKRAEKVDILEWIYTKV